MEPSLFLILICAYHTSAVSIIPELKCNVLRFGYRVNFRYECMLSHSFDRFYVVTKIEIPSHPYILLNRTVLCNCIIEVENKFLLESIAACDPASTDVDL